MKITADRFVELWLELSKSHDLKNKYQLTNKTWTESLIGKATCRNEQSPFGIFIKEQTNKNFVCRNEDGDVDMSLSGYGAFEVFPVGKKNVQEMISLNDYPTNYNILIEHENDIKLCYQEMIKLTYYKSSLKVLVTYNYDENAENQWQKTEANAVANFSSILQQTNSEMPENKDTEYMFIIGQMKKNLPVLKWTFVIYGIHGKEISRRMELETL